MSKEIKIKNITLGDGTAKICIPLVANNIEGLKEQIKEAKASGPDLLEWRGDHFKDWNNGELCAHALDIVKNAFPKVPVIATMRTQNEGGEAAPTKGEYLEFYKNILKRDLADIIDGELSMGDECIRELVKLANDKGAYVIGSYHNFKITPSCEEMVSKLENIKASGAHIQKIAVMPGSKMDVVELMRASRLYLDKNPDGIVITMSMGALGSISRVVCHITGSCLTFATAGTSSAPGQLSGQAVREINNYCNPFLGCWDNFLQSPIAKS